MRDQKKMDDDIQTRTSKPCRPVFVGGMYADREPGKVKVTRIRTTPDEPFVPHLGTVTCTLLDLEEGSKPDSPRHSGTSDEELTENLAINTPKRFPRKIIFANSIAQRLNNSIELSDDDLKVTPKKNKQKVASHVVVNKLKRPLKVNPRKILVNVEEEVPFKKKSVIVIAPKSNNVKIAAGKQKLGKPERLKVKKVIVKRNTGTLQSDFVAEERPKRIINRSVSPKWQHDGFQEIIDDDDKEDKEEEEEEEEEGGISIRKSLKSRLGAQNVINDDSDVSVESVKVNSQIRKTITIKNKINQKSKINQRSKPQNVVSDKRNIQKDSPVVQLSDSEEWTEKVDHGITEGNRKTLKQSKNGGSDVSRVTLKSTIHEEKVETLKNLCTLSARGQTRKIDSNKDSLNSGKTSNRNDRKHRSTKKMLDSSFTDSSGDERYKERVDIMRKRDERFNNNRHRNRHR